tara:strand:- start:44529 stop:44849 length:321 start_codon:yes stop_codon:yes gene_type:complete
MENSIDLLWWVSVIDIPALTALFGLIWHVKQKGEEAVIEMHRLVDNRVMQLREALSAHKLETAKSYARLSHVHALEDRLTSHLLRIEAKLDRTALKTEAFHPTKNV